MPRALTRFHHSGQRQFVGFCAIAVARGQAAANHDRNILWLDRLESKTSPQGAQNQTQMPVRQLVDDGLKNYWKDLAAPQGFEPRYADPESAVLPLNEGAVNGWNKT